ncbi:hypothetical protein IE53DRAFT_366416 [Violaceomyces palustris]|uniref:Uncharacterized protein n=1 Tax=Violaceomyces palustris TaxID=1673888 RepID=A0ACD0P5N8_9BASI|nr:hypothetical protein IE53DRAFT_366416 [Violaceomyces palustris]
MFASTLKNATGLRGVRAFSQSHSSNMARMQLVGRLVADPEIRSTKNGKDFMRYTVATTDPPTGPVGEDGERPPQTTSYHRLYVFGERNIERMKNIHKGYQVLVDADFRIERTPPADGEGPARDTYLTTHRGIQVLSKPRAPESE